MWESMASGYLLAVSPSDSITGNLDNLSVTFGGEPSFGCTRALRVI
jgi:hypothetical protein